MKNLSEIFPSRDMTIEKCEELYVKMKWCSICHNGSLNRFEMERKERKC